MPTASIWSSVQARVVALSQNPFPKLSFQSKPFNLTPMLDWAIASSGKILKKADIPRTLRKVINALDVIKDKSAHADALLSSVLK